MHALSETIRLCQEGDGKAWQELVECYQARVYAVCVYYLRNQDDAVDASQEVFVKVFHKLGDFQDEGENSDGFLAWLLSIARNSCFDRIRADNTRARYHGAYQKTVSGVDDSASPEATLDKAQQRGLLYRALAGFSDVNRDIVLLKDIQGLKLDDVAKILKLPVGTIKSRSNRARVKLGKLLTELKP